MYTEQMQYVTCEVCPISLKQGCVCQSMSIHWVSRQPLSQRTGAACKLWSMAMPVPVAVTVWHCTAEPETIIQIKSLTYCTIQEGRTHHRSRSSSHNRAKHLEIRQTRFSCENKNTNTLEPRPHNRKRHAPH